MSSSKTLFAFVCLLCLALPATAEKPTDNRATSNDSRSSDYSQQTESDYTKEVGGKTLEQWKKDLTDPDPSVRAAALSVIPFFKQAAKVVPDVIKRLQDPDASPRVKAAIALRMIPHFDTDRVRVIHALGHAISHDNQTIIRYEAAVTLRYFCPLKGKDERDALMDLVTSLSSTSTFELRDACIEGLIMAGVDPKTGPDPRVTDALILRANRASEPTTQVRLKAIMALGAMGRPQDPKKLANVMNILKAQGNFKSSHPTIRIWSHVAVMALEEKVKDEDLKTVANYMNEREAAVRVQAVTALGALEDKAHTYVGKICDLLRREKDPGVKAAAATALGRMNNHGERVINALIEMTDDRKPENFNMVVSACNALAQLGVNTPEVTQAMAKVLEHESLQSYQKRMIQKAIDDLKNPPKKPVKDPAKNLDKGIGGAAK